MAKGELLPPVHILLAYAADGWAAQYGQFNPSGKPKPPPRAVWRSVAITLLREQDGVDRLRDLALAGMAAWNVDPSIMACVAPAFATPDMTARLAWRLGTSLAPRPQPAPSPATDPANVVVAPEAESPTPSAAPPRGSMPPWLRKP